MSQRRVGALRGLGLGAVLLGAALGTTACGDGEAVARGGALVDAAELPPSIGTVGDFALTERSGRPVTAADLAGRVWVVDFFFSTCTGPCPALSRNMLRLQDELAGTGVQLVSVTVDPRVDDPATLAAYADDLGADPDRWWFLTGDEEATYALIRERFYAAVERAPEAQALPGQQVTHATRFYVVDRDGAIRGYHDGRTEDGVAATAALARRLDARGRP